MKKTLIAMLLFVVSMPLAAQSRQRYDGEVTRDLSPDGLTIVETLRGKAAAAHLANLQTRKAKAFARAAADLRQRGYTPTDHVVVYRTIERYARGKSKNEIAPAQATASDARGEVTAWAWDDGNNATWEGSIYYENYETGAAALVDAQINVGSTTSWEAIWDNEVYSTGGTPRGGEYMTSLDKPAPVQVASRGPLARRDIQLVQRSAKFNAFVNCFTASCSGVIVGCAFAGPAALECVIGGCVAAIVTCGIQTYLM